MDELSVFFDKLRLHDNDRNVLIGQHKIKSIKHLIAKVRFSGGRKSLNVSRHAQIRLLSSINHLAERKRELSSASPIGSIDELLKEFLSTRHWERSIIQQYLNRKFGGILPNFEEDADNEEDAEPCLLSEEKATAKRTRVANRKVRDSETKTSSCSEDEPSDDEISELVKDSPWDYDEERDEMVLSLVRIPVSIFRDHLLPHQRDGLAWLWKRYKEKIGGILSDEMGLGKTRQVLVFIFALMQTGNTRRALVVCPPTIVERFLEEKDKLIDGFTELKRNAIFVKISKGDDIFARKSALKQALKSDKPVLAVASDCLLRRDKSKGVHPLFPSRSHYWDYIAIDEAHRAKNFKSGRHKALKKLPRPQTHLMMMSATPMQNNPEELHALINWVTKGDILGSLTAFKSGYGAQIRAGLSAAASKQLQAELGPYILQRKVADLEKKLPSKKDFVLAIPPSEEQRECMKEYVESEEVAEIFGPNGEVSRASAFAAITRLRMICCSAFFKHKRNDGEVDDFLSKHSSPEGHEELLRQSPKLRVCLDLLKAFCSSGHKTLVFSQFTKELDFIQHLLQDHVYRIDGKTEQRKRTKYIKAFNKSDSKCRVVLLSTAAGGLGVTLTGADRVILLDPSWNPETDEQAAARAYRIGQTRPVEIYRTITAIGVEEKMLCRQIDKKGMIREIFTEAPLKRYFSQEELKDVFSLESKMDRLDSARATSNSTQHFELIMNHPNVSNLLQYEKIYKAAMTAFGGSKSEWSIESEFAEIQSEDGVAPNKKRTASVMLGSTSEAASSDTSSDHQSNDETMDVLDTTMKDTSDADSEAENEFE